MSYQETLSTLTVTVTFDRPYYVGDKLGLVLAQDHIMNWTKMCRFPVKSWGKVKRLSDCSFSLKYKK